MLVKDCPGGIVVAGEETPQLTYRSWTFIPKALIVEIKYIGQKPRKKKDPPISAEHIVTPGGPEEC